MKRCLLILLLIFTTGLAACNSLAAPASSTSSPVLSTTVPTSAKSTVSQSLTVFAASSLAEAFTELGKQFEAKHPGAKLIYNFAGSQQLARQLAQGAPADVFASANQEQMDAVIQAGRISAEQSSALVGNSLVVIFAQPNLGNIRQLQDLASPGLKLVLADKNAPVGRYSLDFLEKASTRPDFGANFKDHVLKNVVSYEENVRAVLTKISLGEADVGIVYTSDISQQAAHNVGVLEIPDDLNMEAIYFIAPVQDSQRADLARAFVNFVLTPKSQELLAKYGFQPVK
jgi:molybdate transport system substrate-binding protein